MIVGAFGLRDSFSYVAARAAFKGITPVSVANTSDIFRDLQRGRLDAAVVPLENTSGGWIEDVLFELMSLSSKDPRFQVIKEVDLPVVLCVAGKNALAKAKRVYSHPYPLVHSRHWLGQRLPKAERIATTSTSEAALRAASDPEAVALCNVTAAKKAGLKILVNEVPSQSLNMTRFVVVSRGGRGAAPAKLRNKSCLWFAAPNQPGALVHNLQVFEKHGVNITRISSRSMDAFKSYRFFLEIDGDLRAKKMQPLVLDLKKSSDEMVIIGSYPILHVSKSILNSLEK
ncbi:MAG: prephenate dehydratase domain-containing protein [candidate division FCPU426 bacterium]